MSIVQLEKDKPRSRCRKWRVFVSGGKDPVTGQRIQKSHRVNGTYSDAAVVESQMKEELKRPVAASLTYEEYAAQWLERRRSVVRPRTYKKDATLVSAVKRSGLRSKVMGDITPADIEKALTDIQTAGSPRAKGDRLAASYMDNIYSCLKAMFDDAAARGDLVRNPIDGVMHHRGEVPARDIPTMDELKSMLSRLDVRDHRQMAILLAATMGLRRSEILAVRWCDIEGGTLHVRHALEDTKAIGLTKRASSVRDLPIPDVVREALPVRRWTLEHDLAHSLALGAIKDMPDVERCSICASPNGEPIAPNSLTIWWCNHKHQITGSGDWTIHDLRHAYITLLAKEGVPISVAAKLAGHKSASVTADIYTRVVTEDKEEAVDAVNKALNL